MDIMLHFIAYATIIDRIDLNTIEHRPAPYFMAEIANAHTLPVCNIYGSWPFCLSLTTSTK